MGERARKENEFLAKQLVKGEKDYVKKKQGKRNIH